MDSLIPMKINGSCCEICLQDPEACFDLPSAFTDLEDISRRIIKQIRTYCIEPIISGFFRDFFFIQVVEDIGSLPILGDGFFSNEPGWVSWVFRVFL